jgi:inner membrane transporter RhtA
MTLMSSAFYEAISRIPLGIAVSIEFLGPLGLALFTSRRPIDVACVLLAVLGVALLAPDIGGSLDPIGVLFAFAGGLCWTGFIILSRRLGQALEGGVGLALAMLVSGVLLLPVAGSQAIAGLIANPATIAMVIGLALFSSALPWLFEYLALKTMPARQYGVLIALEPVAATVVGLLALAEAIEPRAWIAIVLITLASIGVTVLGKREA